jgi:hypothetical protein
MSVAHCFETPGYSVSKDQLGRDGLFWAAERGQVEIVKLLMSLDTGEYIAKNSNLWPQA